MSSPSVVDGDRQLRGRDFSINFTSEKACLSCLHIKSVDAAWNGSLIVIKSFVSALETVFFLLRRYSFKHPKIQSFRSEYALYSNVYNFLPGLECFNTYSGKKVTVLLEKIVLSTVK